MEPVFMFLGQSSGAAASFAIDTDAPVQSVNYERLKEKLSAGRPDSQLPGTPGPPAQFTALGSLKGIVVDESEAKLTGAWTKSILALGVHQGYHHDGDARDGKAAARFPVELPEPGEYEVQIAYSKHGNRATNAPVTIDHADGATEATLNQWHRPAVNRLFTAVGRFRFEKTGGVTISNRGTNGHVIIDAVRWLPVER